MTEVNGDGNPDKLVFVKLTKSARVSAENLYRYLLTVTSVLLCWNRSNYQRFAEIGVRMSLEVSDKLLAYWLWCHGAANECKGCRPLNPYKLGVDGLDWLSYGGTV